MSEKSPILKTPTQTFVASGALIALYLSACAISNNAYWLSAAMLGLACTGLYILIRNPVSESKQHLK